jgi:hypothetical protein
MRKNYTWGQGAHTLVSVSLNSRSLNFTGRFVNAGTRGKLFEYRAVGKIVNGILAKLLPSAKNPDVINQSTGSNLRIFAPAHLKNKYHGLKFTYYAFGTWCFSLFTSFFPSFFLWSGDSGRELARQIEVGLEIGWEFRFSGNAPT